MKITDKFLKSKLNKSVDKEVTYTDGASSLSIRHSPKGKLTFQVRFQYFGKPVRMKLGAYPAISLAEARLKAESAKEKASVGVDPRREIKEVRPITFHELFMNWYEGYAKRNVKKHSEILSFYENHLCALVGSDIATELSTTDWINVINKIIDTKSKDTAKRALGNSKQVYNWGALVDLVPQNPLQNLQAVKDFGLKPSTRERVLSPREVRLFFNELAASRIAERTKIYMRLLLIYGCRSSELRLAEDSHLDFNNLTWTVPAENHKTGHENDKPLVRPIIRECEPLFHRLIELSAYSVYLFPNPEGNAPVHRAAINQACYKIADKLREKGVAVEKFSVHDLRRTHRTNMSTIAEYHIAEKMLGHSLGKISKTYDHEEYLYDMNEALSNWVHRIDGFIDGKESEHNKKKWPPS